MATLAEFRAAYPDIALKILGSGPIYNLGSREADVVDPITAENNVITLQVSNN